MQALFWVSAAAVFALAASLMMLTCAANGFLLRLSHQMVISTSWFSLVRKHGLWVAIWQTVKAAAQGGIGQLGLRIYRKREIAALVILVPGAGFVSGIVFPGLIPYLFLPPRFGQTRFASILNETAFLCGFLGALCATYVWLQGLSYVAKHSITKRSRLPRLWFPAKFTDEMRDHISLNVYWHSRIWAAVFFSATYPWWLIIVMLYNYPGDSSGTATASSQTDAPILSLLLMILLLSPTMIPALITARFIENRMISARLCMEISEMLRPEDVENKAENAVSESKYYGLFPDPLGHRRWELAQLSRHLVESARRLEAQQTRGFRMHPAATLMRASSRSISQFLGNERSLQESVPEDLTEILEATLALFAGHRDPTVYQGLAKQVNAFDENGNPVIEQTAKPANKLAVLATHIADAVPKTVLVITSITTVTAITIALILALTHQMDPTQLLPYLHG